MSNIMPKLKEFGYDQCPVCSFNPDKVLKSILALEELQEEKIKTNDEDWLRYGKERANNTRKEVKAAIERLFR